MRQSLPLCVAQQARKLLGNNRSYRFSSICMSKEWDQRHIACAALMLAADEYNKSVVISDPGAGADAEEGLVSRERRRVMKGAGALDSSVHDVDDGINGIDAGAGVKNGYEYDPLTLSSSSSSSSSSSDHHPSAADGGGAADSGGYEAIDFSQWNTIYRVDMDKVRCLPPVIHLT